MRSKWPTSSELTQEVMSVLAKFGGSATVEQIDKEVISSCWRASGCFLEIGDIDTCLEVGSNSRGI